MGTALAMESTQSARDTIAASTPPPGIDVHVTGPSAVVNDEMVAINDSIILLVSVCALLVGAVLLLVDLFLALTGAGVAAVVTFGTGWAMLSAPAMFLGWIAYGVTGDTVRHRYANLASYVVGLVFAAATTLVINRLQPSLVVCLSFG